jgi:hypothetical protein
VQLPIDDLEIPCTESPPELAEPAAVQTAQTGLADLTGMCEGPHMHELHHEPILGMQALEAFDQVGSRGSLCEANLIAVDCNASYLK